MKLTDKQRFALVAVRNGAVRHSVIRRGWRQFNNYAAYDSDVTSQVRSLVRRKLCKHDGRRVVLTDEGRKIL